MIRHVARDFDPELLIEEHLITPAHVISEGLLGKFDSLRVALEHLQTHGTANTILAVLASGGELQFSEDGLEALCESFERWLVDAGLSICPEDASDEYLPHTSR